MEFMFKVHFKKIWHYFEYSVKHTPFIFRVTFLTVMMMTSSVFCLDKNSQTLVMVLHHVVRAHHQILT